MALAVVLANVDQDVFVVLCLQDLQLEHVSRMWEQHLCWHHARVLGCMRVCVRVPGLYWFFVIQMELDVKKHDARQRYTTSLST